MGLLHDAGAGEEFVAQGMDGFEDEEAGAFWGFLSFRRAGLDLEAGDQVVGESGEDLPGRVAGVSLGGDGVEGIAVLDLGQSFFVGAATGQEVPERLEPDRLVGGACDRWRCARCASRWG